MPDYPHYERGDLIERFDTEEGAALYHNGKLVYNTGGDSYHADEALFAMVGGTYYSAEDGYDFYLGTDREVAQTTSEIFLYKTERDDKLARAAELRAQAAALEAEAEGLI